MPTPTVVQKFLGDVDNSLHQPSRVTDVLATIETKTGVKRLHLVAGIAVSHALYLVFGHFAALVCNFIGFLYPAYVSVTAIETITKEDDTQWLTYWVVFALLNVLECVGAEIYSYLPFYWLLKCIFLLWLYLPQTLGAQQLYQRFIRPFHAKHRGNFEQVIKNAGDSARKAFEKNVKAN